jgi:GR25 family glycosyltransferase involved in LPS biosynthesis
MRVPLWLLFLNWFTPEPHLQRNPNSLPWKWAVEPDTDRDAEGRDFCAFVVSNPSNPVRNAAFEQVHSYKPVHSGGNYKNNIGGAIYHLYGGGGGGDVAKHAFLKKHRFCICYENSLAPGYVTEKLLHAKLAGCIPLYWGAAEAAEDFDPAGFVNFNGKESDLLQVIQQLEANPAALQKMAATPALDGARLKKARETLLAVGRRLLQLLDLPAATLPAAATAAIAAPAVEPLMLSATSAAPATAAAPAAAAPAAPAAAAAEPNPLFVTFATKSYLPSLESALHGWATLRKQAGLDVITWLGHDISDEEEAKLRALYDWVTYKRLPHSSPVPDFPDFWTPKMFGWKLWILKTTCDDASLANRLVLYSDAGAVWIDFPAPMIKVASQEGVCLLIDKEQINRNWCSPEMVRAMNVNEKELAQHQLMAFTLGFVAGHPVAKRLFDEAFLWGSKRECLFGPYFAGINASGQPYGHRHDQSILSILALRQKAPCIVGNPLMNLISLRKTYQSGAAVYLHRGNYARHRRPLPGVDDVWVVSLDRRADRWASWKAAHPEMAGIANRLCAVDGKALALTPALFTLFEHNDFHWKKSVVGCALSHILLWAQLVSEHPDVQNYLIFEDDHRFKNPNWPIAFEKAMRNAPADAELLYFGGVLPGNKPAYKQCIQPVNEVWATIKPNNMFTGENGPMVPVFHFCAYSYLLTRKGAEKLLAVLRTQGCGTSIDHFLGWPAHGLKKYVMRDLLATCFQEDDPLYVNSQFDDMKRVDTFDSDIWNNAECFTAAANLSTYPTNQPQAPLWKCITDVLAQAPANIQTHRTLREKAVNGQIPAQTMQVFFHPASRDGQMEGPWLRDLFPGLILQPFSLSAVLACPDPWLLFARPNIEEWNEVAAELEQRKKSFSILHLSDEGCADNLRAYASPFCKKVLRNYVRQDCYRNEKVKVLPLGYAATPSVGSPHPAFADRSHVWSFHGTRWFDRPQQLSALAPHTPFSLHFQDTFLDPSMTPITDYSKLLLDSKFVPAPRGNNCETFRFYEALEHGCIPLYVRTPGDAVYWSWLKEHLELVELKSWAAAATLVKYLLENPAKAEMYRQGLCKQWDAWKQTYRITGR